MLNSVKENTDDYSVGVRKTMEKELQALRIQKTKLKPLDDQIDVLENLVARRTSIVEEAQQEMKNAQLHVQESVQALSVAKEQLMQVKNMKASEDAEKKTTGNVTLPGVQGLQAAMCLSKFYY